MRRPTLAVLLALVPAAACSPSGRASPPRLAEWPENPCAVLTAEQVSAATGLVLTKARRAPSIAKIVQARGQDPGPGKYICVYETQSDLGHVTIIAPTEDRRSTGAYWAAREEYFRTFPGSARAVPNLGEDAWIGAGAVLHVLARRDLYFAVAVQMYHASAADVLIPLARAVLAQF